MKPIFEVRYKSGKSYKIYEDGKIEGFEPQAMISNGIPGRINQAYAQGMLKTRDIFSNCLAKISECKIELKKTNYNEQLERLIEDKDPAEQERLRKIAYMSRR